MKKKVISTVIIATIMLLVSFGTWYFWPRYVKLELVGTIQNQNIKVNEGGTEFLTELHWWFIESYPGSENHPKMGTLSPDSNRKQIGFNSESLENWGINFNALGIDFNKNNVIMSFSREIKELKFKRSDSFPYQVVSTVKTVMSKEFHPNTIYVYIIPKYEVREDLRAYTETSVEP